MQVRLKLNPDRQEQMRRELIDLGLEISDDADLILTEEDYREGEILCRKDGDHYRIPIDDVLYVESMGKEIFVFADNQRFSTKIRLYELEKILPSEKFIRISNSVIIRKNAIKKIRPALGQKFYLTLRNGTVVDVTRSYYCRFKDYYGI